MSVFIADEQDEAPVAIDALRDLAGHVLADQRVPDAMEVSVLCVDREAMTELNHRHMGTSAPTDVLAFPIDLPGEVVEGEPALLGDVVICPDVAVAQAAERGHDGHEEMELLVVHGILHLLGHDHADPADRAVMFALTDRILASFRERHR